MIKKLIAGNWKMNGSRAQTKELIGALGDYLRAENSILDVADILVCPPFTYIPEARIAVDRHNAAMILGAQDCSPYGPGAYTGDISAGMLAEFGCRYVILGHSERRGYYQESDELIAAKAAKAQEQNLTAIICVGETAAQREAGDHENIVGAQLAGAIPDQGATAHNTVIAYEPVWAIGTGKTATIDDVKAMHAFIRRRLQEKLEDSAQIRILYGGSVKPENAAELLSVENVDGALVGGASLDADSFMAIARAAGTEK